MTIRREIDVNKPPTDEQRAMLEALNERPAVPDDDCPELTRGEMEKFAALAGERRGELVCSLSHDFVVPAPSEREPKSLP